MAVVCEFDRIFTKSVPHILEKLFFSLDYKSFKNCLVVSKSWNDLLTSEAFRKRSKSVFGEDIQEDLRVAAERGNIDIIRRVLSSFVVDMNSITESDRSPLILAAGNGHKDVVHLLLDRGADPNLASQNGSNPRRNGSTPLHYAAFKGHTDVVQLLLDRGAEPNMANQHGRTPLHYAAWKGHKDVAKLLLDRGAEPNMAAQNWMTPLSYALQMGHMDVANILTENGGTA